MRLPGKVVSAPPVTRLTLKTITSHRIPSGPEAPAVARELVEPLRADMDETSWLDLRLLVSEVVTNAARHAGLGEGEEIGFVLDRRDGHVRVEVHDGGDGFDPPEGPLEPGGIGGWGLYLVDRVSSRWGSSRAPDAHVWFEVPATPGRQDSGGR